MSAGKALTDDMLLKLRALMYFPCCSVLLFSASERYDFDAVRACVGHAATSQDDH